MMDYPLVDSLHAWLCYLATGHTERMKFSNRTSPGSQFVGTVVLVFLLCGNISAQEFKTVHPGIEYARVDHKLGIDPVKVNLLRLDLRKVRLDVHHAFDRAIGVQPTSEIAKRNGAIAAINAGFFRLDKTEFAGDAAGILVIDGVLWSESHNDRIALRIRNRSGRTDVTFDHLRTELSVSPFSNGGESVSGINRERKPSEIIVYTPEFGASTLTDNLGAEIVFDRCPGTCVRIVETGGNSPIPRGGFVVSFGPQRRADMERLRGSVGAVKDDFGSATAADLKVKMLVVNEPIPFQIAASDDITNGVARLIRSGKIDITWEQEKASKSFAEMRHPRTAVAKLKNGKFLMITVDGRQPGVSVGMTLQELADYLFSLGAVDAMNLDGGGSTTMFLDGKVVNTPSDKDGERKVSDSIIVTLRHKR
jgi:hypothetical protein